MRILIDLSQDRDYWRSLVNATLNLWVPLTIELDKSKPLLSSLQTNIPSILFLFTENFCIELPIVVRVMIVIRRMCY